MQRISRRGAAMLIMAAATGMAASLAGCGSAAAPRQPAAAPRGSASPAAAAPAGAAGLGACRAASLRITVNAGQAGGAAGSVYYPVDFTNTSRSACVMYGYPGVSFVTSDGPAGRQIGAAAQRNPGFGKLAIRLEAGGAAHAWLQVAEAGNYPASACRPVKAHWLRVFAPGQTAPSFVSHAFDACGSARVALLTVMPVRAGAGMQGRTP